MDVGVKRGIEAKVFAGERLDREDGIALYGSDDLLWLGRLAHHKRSELHGDRVTFGTGGAEASIVYGGGDSPEQRVDELLRLRERQDAEGGLAVLVPLRREEAEVAPAETLKTFAISRLLLDNVPHLGCRRELVGNSVAQLTLNFGADDLDGSAGDEELLELIGDAGFEPVERDADFGVVKAYGPPVPYATRRSEPQKVWA
jgi:2-iminoacetate synthase ThiH